MYLFTYISLIWYLFKFLTCSATNKEKRNFLQKTNFEKIINLIVKYVREASGRKFAGF